MNAPLYKGFSEAKQKNTVNHKFFWRIDAKNACIYTVFAISRKGGKNEIAVFLAFFDGEQWNLRLFLPGGTKPRKLQNFLSLFELIFLR